MPLISAERITEVAEICNLSYITGIKVTLDNLFGVSTIPDADGAPSPLSDDLRERVERFKAELDEMGVEGRIALVNAARRNGRWPRARRYVQSHAGKWGRGRNADQYIAWAQTLKNRAGTEVHAYIHPVTKDRGIAFVDHREGALVQVTLERDLNMDCMSPSQGTRRYLADHQTYWRLRETEL